MTINTTGPFGLKIRRRGLMLAAAALLGTGTLTAPAAQAQQELRYNLGLPEVHSFYPSVTKFAETMGKIGLPMRVFTMNLLSQGDTPNGVRDGLADAGMVNPPYVANELSEANLVNNLSMLVTSGTKADIPGAAMAGATMEYIFFNCPECLEQYKAMNMVYVANASTGAYDIQCKTPIKTIDDFAGKRLRSGAGNFSRIAEYFGSTAITVPGAELYDALDKGVVDCTMLSSAELVGLRLKDIATSVLRGFPGGVFSGLNLVTFNKEIWQGFTNEQRAEILKAAARISAEATLAFQAGETAALETAKAEGIEIFEADEATRTKVNEFVQQDLATVAGQWTNDYKLQNVDAKIKLISELVEKWKGLTNAVGNDPEKLTELYWTELHSKLDPTTYGMN